MEGQARGDIHKILSTILEQNKIVIEENKKLREESQEMLIILKAQQEQNKKKDDENAKLKEESRKMFTHFTEEFISLKCVVKQTLSELKRKNNILSVLPPLPLSTVDDVIQFNQDIKNDEEKKSELLWRFNRQPYDDVRKFITNNLKLIFSDELSANKFSWTSANNNIPVKDFYFIKLLQDLAVDNIAQTNHQTVEMHTKKFFNLAKDRLNKCNKRKCES